jgi:hypothetical protein
MSGNLPEDTYKVCTINVLRYKAPNNKEKGDNGGSVRDE